MKIPELLAPAGDLNKLKIAIKYGADAVFLGGQEFGLRSGSDNFSLEDIEIGAKIAKDNNVKLYVTTNIFAHQENFEGFKEFVMHLDKVGVTGVIISDPGYIRIVKKYTNLEVHISTQHSVNNIKAVKFLEKVGVDRVVLGRELTMQEIEDIAKNTDAEIEVFVHGAVCSSYSGRCTLSNHMTMRDSNRGGCCQSCRWNYELVEKNNSKYEKVVDTNSPYHKFNMSAKDMNLITKIPELMNLGVDSFKVEGRMKSFHYVATVIKVYRQAIDAYVQNPQNYKLKKEWVEEIQKAESRPISEGSFSNILDDSAQIFGEQYQNKSFDYCGIILDYDKDTKMALIEQRNFFKVNDTIEITGPKTSPFRHQISEIFDEEGNIIEKANHPLMRVKIKIEGDIAKDFILRKEN